MLIPTFASSTPPAGQVFVPPDRFEAAGKVRSAAFCARDVAERLSERNEGCADQRVSLRTGMRYESKVHRFVAERWKSFGSYLPSPWIEFFSSGGKKRFCQPDAIFTHRDGAVVVIEVKLTHTQNAWWQLRKLYEPVVKTLTGKVPTVVEIVKHCDPLMSFPEPIDLCKDFDTFAYLDREKFNVIILDI